MGWVIAVVCVMRVFIIAGQACCSLSVFRVRVRVFPVQRIRGHDASLTEEVEVIYWDDVKRKNSQ